MSLLYSAGRMPAAWAGLRPRVRPGIFKITVYEAWAAVVGWNGAVIEVGNSRRLHLLPKQDESQLWKISGGDQRENRVAMVTPDNDWLVYDEQLPLVREYCANPRGWIQDHRRVRLWDPQRPDAKLAMILAVYPDALAAQAVRLRVLAVNRGLTSLKPVPAP